jgi:hypothetical protein
MAESRRTEYLAECLWPGVTEGDLADLGARAGASAEATAGDRHEVRYLGLTLIPGDEVVFFVFGGTSAEAIRAVAGRAGIPFERIVESVHVAGPDEKGER